MRISACSRPHQRRNAHLGGLVGTDLGLYIPQAYNRDVEAKRAGRRLNMRLRREQEELLRKAAAEQGETLSGFVLGAATERAREVIDQAERIAISRDTFDRFAKALNDSVEDMPVLRRYAQSS